MHNSESFEGDIIDGRGRRIFRLSQSREGG